MVWIGRLVEDTSAGLKGKVDRRRQKSEKAKQVKWKKNALRHSFISYVSPLGVANRRVDQLEAVGPTFGTRAKSFR
jgi:hypothetical protein